MQSAIHLDVVFLDTVWPTVLKTEETREMTGFAKDYYCTANDKKRQKAALYSSILKNNQYKKKIVNNWYFFS